MHNLSSLFSLKDKYILITGAAGLLGIKHAEAIALAGGKPILTDINTDSLKRISEEIENKYNTTCLFFKMDVTSEISVNEIYNILKGKNIFVNVLINNAARNPKVEDSTNKLNLRNRLEFLDLESWNLDISVGLTGAVICSKVFGTCMANRKKGNIINISSDLGIIAPDQRLYRKENLLDSEQDVKPASYSVVKHGLIGLTKYFASYWGDKNVRCNALSPGGILNEQNSTFLKNIQDRIPLGRMAYADEYQGAIIFLSSDASSYMNGSNLIMDGGRSIW
ncbi:SDR family oxidoreductase [Fluviispira sanaruensis]|uniref:KR domain-containing protein n=1 Tax=Fluviispira sanaruensis TaxID=2493639 RepID=A0A4P2VMS5_FLUSA|nr:SDR family oxidoreductase [Fluviispira sanaruensis]BBH54098.1 KR domain-containing protein [Fluviispira sanaruensis]